jgi:hypothetical protein
MEKVLHMFYSLLEKELAQWDGLESVNEKELVYQLMNAQTYNEDVLRMKVKTIGRFHRIYRIRMEMAEEIMMIKKFCSDGKIPKGLLLEG